MKLREQLYSIKYNPSKERASAFWNRSGGIVRMYNGLLDVKSLTDDEFYNATSKALPDIKNLNFLNMHQQNKPLSYEKLHSVHFGCPSRKRKGMEIKIIIIEVVVEIEGVEAVIIIVVVQNVQMKVRTIRMLKEVESTIKEEGEIKIEIIREKTNRTAMINKTKINSKTKETGKLVERGNKTDKERENEFEREKEKEIVNSNLGNCSDFDVTVRDRNIVLID
ncbi:hypothetical protein TSAR_011231 [Trichomalopsis sarcophagae]|uniref:Uncharacterized protein n=1 Tax=Trichomalopsis sarcophagae TaxID=543379 RepID=A0A232FHV6_9HYME|nr:hypothetical protein TSAR_011231 [Trichomalopsis sarcophagae]